MTQRQISHASGELPACTCGKAPKHFEDRRAARSGGGHLLECHPCDRKTAKHPSFDAALQDWCRQVGVSVQPSHSPRVRAIR